MPRTKRVIIDQVAATQNTLEQSVERVANELRHLALDGDWEVLKSVFRVLDAHARARELRAQGQPARAHLWLVGVGQKHPKAKTPPKPSSPQPAA